MNEKMTENLLPTTIDEIDALKIERFQLLINNLQLQMAQVITQRDILNTEMMKKYRLSPDDSIDLAKQTITRKNG